MNKIDIVLCLLVLYSVWLHVEIDLGLGPKNVANNIPRIEKAEMSAEASFVMKRSVEELSQTPADVMVEIETVKGMIQALSRILIKAQSTEEQRVRLESTSGITESRTYLASMQPYHMLNYNIMNMHDHANTVRVVGMGEVGAVLNGVTFWTRHNDYNLATPINARGDSNYNRLVDIVQPPVPPSVLALADVNAQVTEMQTYFRAWQTNNISLRDYRKYFIPTLCVLEGAWIQDAVNIAEPFASDRHHIDAATWQELNDMTRFLFNSGRKNNLENLPYLPSAIRDMYVREDYSVSVGAAAAQPIFVLKRTADSPSSYWSSTGAASAVSNGVVVINAMTGAGLYLFVGIDKASTSTGGTVSMTMTCTGPGCVAANTKSPGVCIPTINNCSVFTAGSGTMNLKWSAGQAIVVAYGPLTDCWNVSLSWSGAAALTGGLYVWRDFGKFVNSTATTLPSSVRIGGCAYEPVPVLANFEYRIFCQPLNNTIPLNRLRVVDDIGVQMTFTPPSAVANLSRTRRALFQLNSRDDNKFYDDPYGYGFIDQLMEQVPGKENAGAYLEETLYNITSLHYVRPQNLNAAYYSRFYKMVDGDAMGRQARKRGFNEDTMWAARTTMSKVSGLKVYTMLDGYAEEKWTWAIPLEIIYLTPLGSWNPYNLTMYPSNSVADADGRNGGFTLATAFNGSNGRVFYRTPEAFFGNSSAGDSADTTQNVVGVLDPTNTVRRCRASGIWVFFPPIPGVGQLVRQRYPIAPTHSRKNPGVQQAYALKHAMNSAPSILNGSFVNLAVSPANLITSAGSDVSRHMHDVFVQSADVERLTLGQSVTVDTDLANTHIHTIKMSATRVGDALSYTIIDCDGAGPVCPDGHGKVCRSGTTCTYP